MSNSISHSNGVNVVCRAERNLIEHAVPCQISLTIIHSERNFPALLCERNKVVKSPCWSCLLEGGVRLMRLLRVLLSDLNNHNKTQPNIQFIYTNIMTLLCYL